MQCNVTEWVFNSSEFSKMLSQFLHWDRLASISLSTTAFFSKMSLDLVEIVSLLGLFQLYILWLILQTPLHLQTYFFTASFSLSFRSFDIKINFCCNTFVSKLTNFSFSLLSLCCFPWSTSQWRFKSLFFHKSFAP